MIKTFKCKETEKIFNGKFSKKLPHDIQGRALIKLHSLDIAEDTRRMNKDDIFIDCNNMLFTIVRAYKKSA